MTQDPSETAQLLRRAHGGDREALNRLIQRDLSAIEGRVRKRLGPQLRAQAETHDIVQEAVIEFLRYGPRFTITDPVHFRALLGRIVENVIRGLHDRFTAACRDRRREQALSETELPTLDVPSASQRLGEQERRDLLELAVHLLPAGERQLILWREWEELSFRTIGERLEATEDAARMRHRRALLSLGILIRRLEKGELPQILESEGPDHD